MNLFFSICSNNYLAQATVLWKSIKRFHPDIPFLLFLCDQKSEAIDYLRIADEVIELETIEPRFAELALKYNIIELNTCCKPRIFEYLFQEKKISQAVFLDPDIKFFHSLQFLFTDFPVSDILLTPHIYSSIPADGKKPDEQSFLIFGIYNLGFVSIRKSEESIKLLSWWKIRTYESGNMDTYKGNYTDQLPMNFVPVFFKRVEILRDPGMNMAPWNLHERFLSYQNGEICVTGHGPLKFFHFSSFTPGMPELPLHYYNRFRLEDRPDLQKIYLEYDLELKEAGHAKFQVLTNAYAEKRKKHLRRIKKRNWTKKFLP